jgi:hypothetical protein
LKRLAGAHLRCLVGALLVTAVPGIGHAQDASQASGVITESTFTKRAWTQSRPNYSYLNGCVTGYRTFVFTDDGYFVFNRNIRGSWRLTTGGNVSLKNRGGQRITLYYDKRFSLTPSITTTVGGSATSSGTRPATTSTTAATSPTSTNPSNTRAAVAPSSAGFASSPSHVIIVPTGKGQNIVVPIPTPTAPPANTTTAQSVQQSNTSSTNPITTVSASGKLQFRRGDQFAQCTQ